MVYTLSPTLAKRASNIPLNGIPPTIAAQFSNAGLASIQRQLRWLKSLVLEYIEACLEKEIYSIRIIHGKGMGVLRTQVHKLLDRHPNVQSYQLAPGNQGHWGATIAKLKAPENR